MAPAVPPSPPLLFLPFLPSLHRPCCHLALPSTAPHAAATLAFSSGTPAAICRRQAWAVKHRDPEFFGPRYASARGPVQMALPTKRGFTVGLKEDDCRRAEDELTPPLLLPPLLPPPASLCQVPNFSSTRLQNTAASIFQS
ncbi:transcription factor COE3-like protein [Lates japonicus]|uniref:Transcription factor COE3-like protein n=1 Tax=Lates japonicus TaxID=270547 RepID=A0AAD3RGD2_LATJO|nr:transcription factor COE3-like protein [Lates japonicus]